MKQIEPKSKKNFENRLEFEKFLADLSARLVALPPDRVDDEIRNALKRGFGVLSDRPL